MTLWIALIVLGFPGPATSPDAYLTLGPFQSRAACEAAIIAVHAETQKPMKAIRDEFRMGRCFPSKLPEKEATQ